MADPQQMRKAMADYIEAVHQAYASQAATHSPAVQGQMALLAGPFTVVAAGVQNLHVVATRQDLPPPRGPEVALPCQLDGLRWTVRFYDPVVFPPLGLIDESAGPAGELVRSAFGLTTYLYHLVVRPGSQLTPHHAGHAGAGLANSHVAAARDFQRMRAHAKGREGLVDEMQGAAAAGLSRAQALLARELAPWSEEVAALTTEAELDTQAIRKAVVASLAGDG